MTLYHAGTSQTEHDQGVYFYVPKLESASEAALYRDMIDEIRNQVSGLNDSTVRVIALVESLPAVWQMEEILHALGPYAAGLNAARWDLKASILEYVMAQPASVWPDRFGVDIKTTEFISNIFRRLVAVCLKHDAVPIGGMATALPSRDEKVNLEAAASIRADKEWEAQQGFLRAWVAHIYHMGPAAAPFKDLAATGWKPGPEMADPDRYPVSIDTPEGPLTEEGSSPERQDTDRVRRGLAFRKGRQGHRQTGWPRWNKTCAYGGPGHGADFSGPDRPASRSFVRGRRYGTCARFGSHGAHGQSRG